MERPNLCEKNNALTVFLGNLHEFLVNLKEVLSLALYKPCISFCLLLKEWLIPDDEVESFRLLKDVYLNSLSLSLSLRLSEVILRRLT